MSRLSLDERAGAYSFSLQAETYGCGYNPAWMELDRSKNALLCLNEAYVSLQYPYNQKSPERDPQETESCDRPFKIPDLSQR